MIKDPLIVAALTLGPVVIASGLFALGIGLERASAAIAAWRTHRRERRMNRLPAPDDPRRRFTDVAMQDWKHREFRRKPVTDWRSAA